MPASFIVVVLVSFLPFFSAFLAMCFLLDLLPLKSNLNGSFLTAKLSDAANAKSPATLVFRGCKSP